MTMMNDDAKVDTFFSFLFPLVPEHHSSPKKVQATCVYNIDRFYERKAHYTYRGRDGGLDVIYNGCVVIRSHMIQFTNVLILFTDAVWCGPTNVFLFFSSFLSSLSLSSALLFLPSFLSLLTHPLTHSLTRSLARSPSTLSY